jgi:catechol 2,3-dioxygenase-like lactoylglutathione lyase family enzyme
MLHHVSVGTSDFVRATRFYDETLATLGYKRVMMFAPKAVAYGETHPVFWVQTPASGEASSGNGSHIAFAAGSQQAVNRFHEVALRMGAKDNGPPGPRPNYTPDYYGAFVIDPDGNKIEAVFMANRAASGGKRKSKAKAARKPTPKRPAVPKRRPAGRKAGAPRRGRTRGR